MPIPTLETDRLILRPVTLDDIPSLQRYFDDWDVIKFTRENWARIRGVDCQIKSEQPGMDNGGKDPCV